jgi:hypothetical protein
LIKFVVKLLVVALIANAGWRVGNAYVSHYKFTDAVEQSVLFRGKRSDDALRERVFELAANFDIPVTDEDLSLRTEDNHTIVEGSYTREIELAPGFVYAWPFSFHIDTLSNII